MEQAFSNQLTFALCLENIGIIKRADIRLSKMCVIAGENDQGKSTVGKSLMAMIKAENMARRRESKTMPDYFNRLIELIFEKEISSGGKIELLENSKPISRVGLKEHRCQSFEIHEKKRKFFLDCTYIQTPLVWDLYSFFSSIQTWQTDELMNRGDEDGFKIKYPYLMWDLYKKLDMDFRDSTYRGMDNLIEDIIGGVFIQERRKYRFYKKNSQNLIAIDLENVATGIKQFGILQTLLKKGRVTPYGFFIFDEPENHLHPTWQLRFAEILVKLSKEGVYIMVNTHSPYMIEALYRYALRDGIEADFHLAENGRISQVNQSNSETLEEIFKRLNEPFEIMDDLKDIEQCQI